MHMSRWNSMNLNKGLFAAIIVPFCCFGQLADTSQAGGGSGDIRGGLSRAQELFEQDRYESCVALLDSLDVPDSLAAQAALLKGSSLGRMGNYRQAVAVLSSGRDRATDRSLRVTIGGRLAFYESRAFQEAAKAAVAHDQDSARPGDSTRLAVIEFVNSQNAARFDPLKKALADMLITDLSQLEGFTVVERSRMHALYAEMGLDQAGITRNGDKARVATLAGAGLVVGGVFAFPDSGTLKLTGGYIDVRNKKTHSIDPLQGEVDKFFELEKNFVFGLIDRLGYSLTDKERERIHRIPTESLVAFLAYGEGLDAMDRQDFAGAARAFAEASRVDPDFQEASVLKETMEQAQRERTELEEVTAPPVDEKPPVAIQGSGPEVTPPAQAAPAAPTAAASATRSSFAIKASLPITSHIATMSGRNFMSEVPVAAHDGGGDAAPLHPTPEPPTTDRADFVDYQGLGLGDGTKEIPIVVELPEAQ